MPGGGILFAGVSQTNGKEGFSMKNMKFWRTALVAALVLTVMLSVTGGTIAWFTDEVSSENNKIQAGNLDIDLYMHNGSEYVEITNESAPIFGGANSLKAQNNNADTLWEPGKTQVAYLKLVNNGNLALKYNVALNVKNETKNLSQAMEYAITPDAKDGTGVTEWVAANGKPVTAGAQDVTGAETEYVSLGVGQTHYFALSIHMMESAGNEYQGGSVDFDITVYALQDTVESDSFDNQYDKDAQYVREVGNAGDLAAALAAGEDVKLIDDITVTESIVIPAAAADADPVVVDMNGKTISGNLARNAGALIVNKGNLIIEGDENSEISNTATNGSSVINNNGVLVINGGKYQGAPSDTSTGTANYAVNTVGSGAVLTVNNANISGRGAIGVTLGSKAVVNGGTYHTPEVAWGHAIYAWNEGSEVTINGGIFSEGYEMAGDNWGMYQIYAGGKAKVTVNGGTFEAWDCANGYDLATASEGVIEIYGGTFAENPSSQNNKNYVAEGYTATQNDNGTWTVTANTTADSECPSLRDSVPPPGTESVDSFPAQASPQGLGYFYAHKPVPLATPGTTCPLPWAAFSRPPKPVPVQGTGRRPLAKWGERGYNDRNDTQENG